MLPNTIIIGVAKAGTTSVFRYLASHPDVCVSSVKEVRYFTRHKDNINEKTLEEYESYFSHCSNAQKIRLEASPSYIVAGKDVAENIKNHIPDVKLILMLREPKSRLLSFYSSHQAKTGKIDSGLSFENFVEISVHGGDESIVSENATHAAEMLYGIKVGNYGTLLKNYLNFFSSGQIRIIFFDDLKNNPQNCIDAICDYLGIDKGIYKDYDFSIENQTSRVEYPVLHKMAASLNQRLEKQLNRTPKLRSFVKSIYYKINKKKGGAYGAISEKAEHTLNEYYAPENEKLLEILEKEFSLKKAPSWLKSNNK